MKFIVQLYIIFFQFSNLNPSNHQNDIILIQQIKKRVEYSPGYPNFELELIPESILIPKGMEAKPELINSTEIRTKTKSYRFHKNWYPSRVKPVLGKN